MVLARAAPPSYHQGYARSAGDSAYPTLRSKMLHGWVPALGFHGLILRDEGPEKVHGVLNANFELDEWQISNGNISLFADASEVVVTAVHQMGLANVNKLSIFASFYAVNDITTRRTIISGANTSLVPQLEVGSGGSTTSGMSIIVSGAFIAQTVSNTLVLNRRHTVTYTRNGSGAGNHRFIVNGSEVGLVTDGSTNYLDTATQRTILARFNTGSQTCDYPVFAVYIFDGAISANEAALLHRDFLAPFRLPQRTIGATAAVATIGPVLRHPYQPYRTLLTR